MIEVKSFYFHPSGIMEINYNDTTIKDPKENSTLLFDFKHKKLIPPTRTAKQVVEIFNALATYFITP